ncbi:MAG: flagellar motor switch protein FliN [Alkalispirochaetaceae bacterium]
MSDGSLSQDEIDALLQGSGNMDFGEPANTNQSLSPEQISGFRGIIEQTIEGQTSNLSMILSAEASISLDNVEAITAEALGTRMTGSVVEVDYNLKEGIVAQHLYFMSEADALALAAAMMGLDDVELDDAGLNAIQEAFSQISGPVLNALGEKAETTVMPEPAEARQTEVDAADLPTPDFVAVTYKLALPERDARVVEIFESSVVTQLVEGSSAGEDDMMAGLEAMAQGQGQQQPQGGGMMAGFGNMGQQQGGQANQGGGMSGPGVQSVQFPNLQQGRASQEQGNIGLLMDVYMEMTVELGRTRKLIKEILGMGEGTIIELDKLAGEPVDILVNHKLIAKGEVVVIDENFGVRVTEIVSPMERVSNMT